VEDALKQTFVGGCHCGAVRFEADLDIALGTVKCNCTICAKNRLWSMTAGPGEVRLLSGAEALVDYTFNDKVAHHYFCRHCGVHPYEWVVLPRQGREYYNVSVVCLEGIDVDALLAAPVEYVDGLHDRWDRVPAEIRLL
jgi:hypothetical protein